MCGCSEEVPNLRAQLLDEEIIYLHSNKRVSSRSSEAALAGMPVVEEKAGSVVGARLSPPGYLTCRILAMPLFPVLTKTLCPLV